MCHLTRQPGLNVSLLLAMEWALAPAARAQKTYELRPRVAVGDCWRFEQTFDQKGTITYVIGTVGRPRMPYEANWTLHLIRGSTINVLRVGKAWPLTLRIAFDPDCGTRMVFK